MSTDAEPGTHDPTDRPPRWWLNQTTVKGVMLLVLGAVIIATPNASEAFGNAAGVLLVAWAIIEFWFRVARSGRHLSARLLSAAESTLVLAVGVLLLSPLGISLSMMAGAYLGIRGVFVLLRSWRASDERHDRVVTGLSLVALGVLVFLTPETIMLGARAVLGTGAIGLGAVLVSGGLGHRTANLSVEELNTASMLKVSTDWLRAQRLAPARRTELAETLFFEPPDRAAKLRSFWVMMLLSVGIASFAVIQNSTAVVIGAMLVAPLMVPIMAVAASMVNGWPARLVTSLLLVAAAVAAAIALAWLIAAWLPSAGDLATNGQIQSRVSPSLLDLCIAVTAGGAGAYATVDPRTSASLPGVAIAVALVPPLAVVGVTLQAGLWGDAGGAFLLFCTNFVSIVLSGALVFFLTGFAVLPFAAERRSRVRRAFQSVLLGGLLILIPLSLTSQSVWNNASNEAATRQAVQDWIPAGADLSIETLNVRGNTVELTLTGSSTPPDTTSLEQTLDATFGTTVTLKAALRPLCRPHARPAPLPAGAPRELTRHPPGRRRGHGVPVSSARG